MKRRAALALAVVLLVVLAACGGDDSDAKSAATTQPKDDPNLAYAIGVNIPKYEGQDLTQFSCQLCKTPTGGKSAPDYLATIDVDTGKVIDRAPVPNTAPELHHMAIDAKAQRAALYDLYRNEANIFDIGTNPRKPKFLKAVDLAKASADLLGPVEGLKDAKGNPIKVGYAMPHASYRLPNNNHLIAMVSPYVPELPEFHLGAPGGFIEMTPDGDVVRAFPSFKFEGGKLTNGLFEGNGVFAVDYDERLGMMAHSDLMTARTFQCGRLLLDEKNAEPGKQVVLWKFDPADSKAATVFQKIDLPAPFMTAPAFVSHPVNGMDIIYVSTFSSGLWALHRPTGTEEQFKMENVYPLASPHGLVHVRLHPDKDVIYLSDPYGDQVHVLDFSKDPLKPAVLQVLDVDEVHMMKFSGDGKTFTTSNGLASILGFGFNPKPFEPSYGMTESTVLPDGKLAPGGRVIFDGKKEPNAPQGVFIGDFFFRRSPQAFI